MTATTKIGALQRSLASSTRIAEPRISLGVATRQQQQRRCNSSSSSSTAPIPLSRLHKVLLGAGSALASLHNPARGDMIALLSELSGERRLPQLRDDMLASHEGRLVLMQRAEISTKTVDMHFLRSLPAHTFGKAYTEWMDWCGVGPDTRAPVLHVDDEELRYVMNRNRQSHDMHHVLCKMPVNHLGETVVKIFEASHFGLPVSFLSSLAGPLRLSTRERAELLRGEGGGLAGWAWRMGKNVKPLIAVHWEGRWEQDFEQMRAELGFTEPAPVHVDYTGKRGRVDSRWPSKVFEAERSARTSS